MIADACSKSMKILIVCGKKLNFKTRTRIESLEELHINGAAVYNFDGHANLKCLKYVNQGANKCDWLFQEFPQLTKVEMAGVHDLTDEMFVKFLTLNPQIREIKVINCYNVLSTILPDIPKCLPNIKAVRFETRRKNVSHTVEKNMVEISKQQTMKSLYVLCPAVTGEKIINTYTEYNPAMEIFSLSLGFKKSLYNGVLQLKLLRELHLVEIRSDTVLFQIANAFPALEKLAVSKARDVSLLGVMSVLVNAKKLKYFSISIINEIKIDSEKYHSILNLAKHRVTVMLILKRGTRINVEKDILKENRKWVLFKYRKCKWCVKMKRNKMKKN